MYNEKETVINILRMFNNGKIYINDLRKIFGSDELGLIRNLYMDESIINVFDINNNDELVTLTRKGKFLLFSHDNKKDIDAFSVVLEEKNLNTSYLGDYLKASNLDRDVSEILSDKDYELFIHNLEQLQNARVTRRILLRNNRNIG